MCPGQAGPSGHPTAFSPSHDVTLTSIGPPLRSLSLRPPTRPRVGSPSSGILGLPHLCRIPGNRRFFCGTLLSARSSPVHHAPAVILQSRTWNAQVSNLRHNRQYRPESGTTRARDALPPRRVQRGKASVYAALRAIPGSFGPCLKYPITLRPTRTPVTSAKIAAARQHCRYALKCSR